MSRPSQTQTAFEKKVLSEISMTRVIDHVKAIAQWTRDSGTEDAGKAFMYIKEKLEANGVQVETYDIDAFLSLGAEAEIKILAPEQKAMKVVAHAFSGSTPANGIEGELIVADGLSEKEIAEMDLQGTILLDPKVNYLVVERVGAKAILQAHVIVQDIPHKSQVKHIWGPPTPQTIEMLAHIPVLSITKNQGALLRKLCSQAKVKIWIRTNVWRGWSKIGLPVAIVKGTSEPERFVLVGAHYDGWWLSATDNATGVGGMMELARVLNKNKNGLRRSVRIAFWPGHSSGTYAGSTYYADNFWQELYENALVFVHHDMPGKKGAGLPLQARIHSELIKLVQTTVKDVTGREVLTRRWGRTGDQSFWGIGVPSFATSESYPPEVVKVSGRGDWWWHTPEDTMDKVDAQNLEITLKADAAAIMRICNSPIIPYEFISVADDFINELQELQKKAGKAFDLKSLVTEGETLKRLTTDLDATVRKIQQDCKDLEQLWENKKTTSINTCLIRLSRVLIPVLYTRAGRFSYDAPAGKIKFLPSLQAVEDLASLGSDSDEFKVLKTQLVRERNRVAFALNEAVEIVSETLEAVRDTR